MENSMLPGEFNAVLTTDWQILAARRCQIVPSDRPRLPTGPALNTLITPGDSGYLHDKFAQIPDKRRV